MYSNPTLTRRVLRILCVLLDYNMCKERSHRSNTLSVSFSDVTISSSSAPDTGFKFTKMTTRSRHAQDRYLNARAWGAVATAAWWACTLIPAQSCLGLRQCFFIQRHSLGDCQYFSWCISTALLKHWGYLLCYEIRRQTEVNKWNKITNGAEIIRERKLDENDGKG